MVPVKSPELARDGWVPESSSEETAREGTPMANAIDGDPLTFWHTNWDALPPHYLTIVLPKPATLSLLRYTPRQDGSTNGTVTDYEIETSPDGVVWTKTASGNWASDSTVKTAGFGMVSTRYVRLWGTGRWMAAAEIALHGVYDPEIRMVKLTMQSAPDLASWADIGEPVMVPQLDKGFFRIKLEPQ
jgi:hypothetical protein